MADLKKLLESLGHKNVRTLLASGNAIFDVSSGTAATLKKDIESAFTKKFGFSSHIILRTIDDIAALVHSNPFRGIPVTKDTRLYVTFFTDKPTSKLKTYTSPDGNFRILRVSEFELCSVLTVAPNSRSVDLMAIVEKEFGKNVTTRNWNTIEKILGK
jgi:uncharacterized protein (DUF1697 family)